MKQYANLRRTWLTLFSITSLLFLIVGIVMMVADRAYFTASQYLVTAIIFAAAIYGIVTDKIEPNYATPMFNMGFIFSVIGLTSPLGPTLQIGLWALGIVLFLSGLFSDSNDGRRKI